MSSAPDLAQALRAVIIDVPDFPKPGVGFKDLSPLYLDAALFRRTTEAMAATWRGTGITHVLAIESRGFLLGGPVAQSLGAGLVPVRKPGKLPRATVRESYTLEYGTDVLELHRDAVSRDGRVLVVDDVLATGGTCAACCRLVEQLGAGIAGVSVVIDLGFLPWRRALEGREVVSLLSY